MTFIDQVMRQEIIPKRPTPGDENVLPWLAFEFGKLLVCVGTPDDADIGPGSG